VNSAPWDEKWKRAAFDKIENGMIKTGREFHAFNLLKNRVLKKALETMNTEIQNIMARANRYHQNGDYHQAKLLYQKILFSDPQNADALQYSGIIAMQCGDLDQAIQLIEKAVTIRPDSSVFHNNLAMAYKDNDQYELAQIHYKKALALNPNNSVLHFNLGALYQTCSQDEDARIAYEQSLRINPNQPLVHHNLCNLLLNHGDVKHAILSAKTAMELSPNNPEIQSNYLFSLNYSIDHSPEEIINAHLKWGQQYRRFNQKKSITQAKNRIHVGYVSPDFRTHSVSHFIEAVLSNHDLQYFDIYCYSNVKKPDDKTNALKKCGVKWRDIYYQKDDVVCNQIQADGIHILVDLAGHSSDNRLMVFAQRPAPIQVTYLGYPNTTGLSQIDYRLVDQNSDPDLNHFCGSEHRIYLPNGFLCYTPSDQAPLISQKKPSKHITFGSFNNLPKMNKHVISLWSELLKAIPDSRLLLKTNGFKVRRIQENYLECFQEYGVDPARIQLMAKVKGEKEHLSLYNEIDVALDTFPYNGTTTTCEALWMGVPVITLKGLSHAARVGESILNQIGLNDWIAHNETDYIKKAIYLAEHPDVCLSCRKHLRKQVAQSLLCKKELFVKTLEKIYCQLVRIFTLN
jgi:predicted O-linked N-acetylglucosamine transferase (SPINDLY family)